MQWCFGELLKDDYACKKKNDPPASKGRLQKSQVYYN